jgi:hypothetical protein
VRRRLLLVIVTTLLSAQAIEVVESGQHNQWGTLRYPVRPGQYTVIGELIEGGGVVGIPQVRNPNPQVVAEQVRSSEVIYTPSRREAPEGAAGEPLILLDPLTREPLAYFNNEQEARYYLGDRYYNWLGDSIIRGDNSSLPHYSSCYSEDCQNISLIAQLYKEEDRLIAENALRDFVETVREVAQAIVDFVLDIVQAVVDFFAGIFDWVQNAAEDIVASIDNDDDDDDEDNDDEDNDDEDNDDDEWYWGDGD